MLSGIPFLGILLVWNSSGEFMKFYWRKLQGKFCREISIGETKQKFHWHQSSIGRKIIALLGKKLVLRINTNNDWLLKALVLKKIIVLLLRTTFTSWSTEDYIELPWEVAESGWGLGMICFVHDMQRADTLHDMLEWNNMINAWHRFMQWYAWPILAMGSWICFPNEIWILKLNFQTRTDFEKWLLDGSWWKWQLLDELILIRPTRWELVKRIDYQKRTRFDLTVSWKVTTIRKLDLI